jgi:hypothetical protein
MHWHIWWLTTNNGRGVVWLICCWPSPAQSFLALGPKEPTTIFYCLTTLRHILICIKETVLSRSLLGQVLKLVVFYYIQHSNIELELVTVAIGWLYAKYSTMYYNDMQTHYNSYKWEFAFSCNRMLSVFWFKYNFTLTLLLCRFILKVGVMVASCHFLVINISVCW